MPPNYAGCGIFLGGIFYAFGILPNQYAVDHVEELDMILPLGFRSPGQASTVVPTHSPNGTAIISRMGNMGHSDPNKLQSLAQAKAVLPQ